MWYIHTLCFSRVSCLQSNNNFLIENEFATADNSKYGYWFSCNVFNNCAIFGPEFKIDREMLYKYKTTSIKASAENFAKKFCFPYIYMEDRNKRHENYWVSGTQISVVEDQSAFISEIRSQDSRFRISSLHVFVISFWTQLRICIFIRYITRSRYALVLTSVSRSCA